jgi:4-alpha-glucanotransferase
MKKLIGTLIPMSALYSSKNFEKDKGTFDAGIIFLDWLKKTNQSAWQMLPLHETQLEENSLDRHIPSPYKSYGIGLHPQYLSTAYTKILPTFKEKALFWEDNKDWIADYVLFCALRDYFHTDDWRKWDKEIRFRNEEALTYWKKKLSDKTDFYLIQQWQLDHSYTVLHTKAKALGITLIGDLPFYISVKSPLVWIFQDVFRIEKDGSMPTVSGIPDINDTYFGRQIWGHPLYNWDSHINNERIILLWKIRIRYLSKLFDYVRFDHANGFFEYGSINIGDAGKDIYEKGPGTHIFENLIDYSHKQSLDVFVEDSGEHIKQLNRSIQRKNISGVKVYLFSFGENPDTINDQYAQISNYSHQTVAYTSTHDTRTLLGFLDFLDAEHKIELAHVSNVPYFSDNKKLAVALRTAILQSPAQIVIIPMQDWLLTTERINIPGTELSVNDPNWHFRLKAPIETLPKIYFVDKD